MRPQISEPYRVHYSYYPCVSRRPPRGEEKCVETLATSALITNEKGQPMARGEAILSPDDVFSMRVAKDVALGRALKELERVEEEAERLFRRRPTHRVRSVDREKIKYKVDVSSQGAQVRGY